MLSNANVVITGCGGGLGIGISLVLAKAGATIIGLDRDDEGLKRFKESLSKAGFPNTKGVLCDVASAESVTQAFHDVDAAGAKIDVLVNCAGVREVKSALDLTPAEWDRVIAINLSGPFYCTKEAAMRMKTTGGGSIINISSVAALLGMPHRPAYNASKHGLMGLTRNLAKDLAPFKIRVNAVAPGLLRTPLTESYFADPEFEKGIVHNVPMGEAGTPEDVGQAILYLVSPMARFVTGVLLPVDGGWSTEKGYTTPDGGSAYTSAAAST